MESLQSGSILTPILLFCISLSARALFSFLETSIAALRLFKIKELAESTRNYTSLFKTLEKHPHRVLVTILIANSLADVTTASLATHIMECFFAKIGLSGNLGFSIGIAFAAFAILIFGEILPKNLAKGRNDRLFRSLLWFIHTIFFLLKPLVALLFRISDYFMQKIGSKYRMEQASEWVASEQEVRFLIEHIAEKGIIEPEKTIMLKNIFELGHKPLKEVMVPATDMVLIDVKKTVYDTLTLFAKYHFTRLPVYQGTIDNIIGMIHLKDVFSVFVNHEDKPLELIMRPILFVPETLKINQLLREFRQQAMHIAIVLNEHGIVTGLITLEDVLEEIVGDISDEHEPIDKKITTLKQGSWLVDARVPIDHLAEYLGVPFESQESLTLGGFLTEQLQHVPKKGERIMYKNMYLQVHKASQRRVLQVIISTNIPKNNISPQA